MILKFILVLFIWNCTSQQILWTKEFEPSGGAVGDGTTVTLQTDTSGAVICVTRWEEFPTCNAAKNGCLTGIQYTSLTKLRADEGWKWYAVACKPGVTDSVVISTQNIWGPNTQPTLVDFSPTGFVQDQGIAFRTSVPSGSGNYVICYAEDDLPDCSNGTACSAGTMYTDSSKPKVLSTTFGKTWVAIVCTDVLTYSDYSYITWGQMSYPYLRPSGGSYSDNSEVAFSFPTNYVPFSGFYFCVGTDIATIPKCDSPNKKCSVGTMVDGTTSKMNKLDIHNGKRWAVITCPPSGSSYSESPIVYTSNWESSSKIPPPVFFPDGGFVTDPVTISVSPPDALICYNSLKDSAIPKCSSSMTSCDQGNKYDPATRIPVSLVPENTKLRAVACRTGYTTDSAVGTSTYEWSKDSTISFSPNGGVVTSGQEVTMTTKIVDSIICFSMDPTNYPICDISGSACSEGTKYDSNQKPKITAESFGLYWIAVPCKRPYDFSTSGVWNALPQPTFSPDSGSVNIGSTITLSSTVSGAIICYFAEVSSSSPDPLCPADLTVDATCLLGTRYDSNNPPKKTKDNTLWKAIACKKGSYPSTVAYATYWKDSATPTFTPDGGSLPDNQPVTISVPTTAIICYSKKGDVNINCNATHCLTDGAIKYDPNNKPTKSSTDNSMYWTAVACESGKEPSPVKKTKGAWNNRVIEPVFTPDGGPMTDKNRVAVSSPTLQSFPTDSVICLCLNDCTDGPKCKSDGKSCESPYTTYNDKNKPQFIKNNHDNKRWRAIACKKDMTASTVKIMTNAWNQVVKPTFWPDGGAVNVGTNIWIQSTEGATICYGQDAGVTCTITNNKGTCTKGNNLAEKPAKITDADLKTNWYAVACKSGLTSSVPGKTKFVWRDPNTIVPPNFNPNGGKVADGSQVSIDTDMEDAVICYTLSTNSTPSCNGDNTGCAIGFSYDASNKPLKQAAHNGVKWQALVCDKVLGPSTLAVTAIWEKYVAAAFSTNIPVTLLVLSLMSFVFAM